MVWALDDITVGTFPHGAACARGGTTLVWCNHALLKTDLVL